MSLKGRIKRLEDAVGIGAECEACGHPFPSGLPVRIVWPDYGDVFEDEYKDEGASYQAERCAVCGRWNGAPVVLVAWDKEDKE